MNIFKEYTHFYGELVSSQLSQSMESFFVLRNSIRQRLGVKAYLLDDYIANYLKAISAISIDDAIFQGNKISNELWRLCINVIEGKENNHPFYNEAEKFINEIAIQFQ